MSLNVENEDHPFKGWTTIEEAAEIVGRDNSTVRRWADRGAIKSVPIGRKVRVVKIDEVRKFASENPPYKKRSGKNHLTKI